MELILGIIAGLALGGGALYALLRERARQLETVLRERDDARVERDKQPEKLVQARKEISAYESTKAAREQEFKDRREELDTHFKRIACDVLKSSTEEFRKQASERFKLHQELAGKDLKERETAVENLVKPVRESLEELRKYVNASDKGRAADTKLVSEGVKNLMAETSGLRKILHNPQLRGEWGEQQQRNVLKAAGMTSSC